MAAATGAAPATARGAIPLLRIFDTRKAMEFYVGFLGFEVAWEHRYDDHAPLYAEVVRDGVRLHLTEHHGDASPGSAVYIEIDDAVGFQQELLAKEYDYARPGVERDGWGWIVTVADPFLNRLMFVERRRPSSGRSDDHGAPVVEEVVVDADPATACEAFTAELGGWWDRRYAPPGTTGARFEQREGGTVALVTADGEVAIGRVTSWQPPQRFSLDFWLAVDPAHPTTLALVFAPEGDRTRVTLTHGGWTAENVAERTTFTDWPVLLDAFAAYVGRR